MVDLESLLDNGRSPMTHTNMHGDHPTTTGGLIAIASLVGVLVILSGCAGLIAWFVAH